MNHTVEEVLRNRIEETRSILETARLQYAKSGLPPFIQQLEISSLEKRLEDLQRELNEVIKVNDRDQLTVILHPPGMSPGHIPVRTLTQILGGLQVLADSVANSIHNQPSERGSIPQEILDYNSLIWRETAASSFKVTMDVQHVGQAQFDEPMQTQTMEELFSLFEVSDATELLVESVSNLGPRTIKHYRDWIRSLKDTGTPIEIEWNSFKGRSQVSFDVEKAKRVYSVLNDISDTVEEEVTVYGRLTGANVRTKTFEVCTPDGQKISGRIINDAVSTVAAIVLDSKCKVKLMKVTTAYSSTGREKVTWTLKSIEIHDY